MEKVVNPSLSARALPSFRMLNRVRRSEFVPCPAVNLPQPMFRLLAKLLRMLIKGGEVFDGDMQERLSMRYHGANQRLAALLGRELPAGYP
jgi:hypothetical protein